MNTIEQLQYASGLTAQGCLDSYDAKALDTYTQLLVNKAIELVEHTDHRRWVCTTFDFAQSQAFKQATIEQLKTLLL
jgi:hypothetical protein